jgi:peptidoglycan/LPS O-acetylase OafA/YrhL
LRAVSILLVVVSHLGLARFVPGAFGVTLFFFISGYLITRQLLGGLATRGHIGLGSFYLRRALRLLPASLAFISLAGAAYLVAGGRITPAGWAAAVFYGANYYDLWAGYRSTLPLVRHPFNILWSLAIEEHFYAIWPLALGFVWRRRIALVSVLALCMVALAWRSWLLGACFHPGAPAYCAPINPNLLWRYNRLYLATDTRLDSIAWGAALALLEQRGRVPPAWLAWPALVLLAASFIGGGPLPRHVLRPSLQGLALLGLLPRLLGGGMVARVCATPVAVFIGRLSYSLYLWHWGALMLADLLARRQTGAWLGLAVALSAGFALTSYYAIERPMLRLRRRFGSAATA